MVCGMDADARIAARRYYAASSRCLAADVAALMQHPDGVVIFTPCLVALAKPVRSSAPERWERLEEHTAAPDAWFVHLLVGDMAAALQLARRFRPLPYICFRRGLRSTRPHVWRRARILSE